MPQDQDGGPAGSMMSLSRSQMPDQGMPGGMPGAVPEQQQAMFAPQVGCLKIWHLVMDFKSVNYQSIIKKHMSWYFSC